MTSTYLYTGFAFIIGFAVAWSIHIVIALKNKKLQKSIEGFLESERLIRERYQKENTWLHEAKELAQHEFEQKKHEMLLTIKMMDEDILLLQKSNEDTEALLKSGDPMVHALKLKLIEAQNTIARYKAQVMVK